MNHFIPPRADPFKGAAPRFIAYCVAHGAKSAAEQEQKDRARWRERWTTPFTVWVGIELLIWCRETKFPAAGMSWDEHAAFSEWLAARYPVRT
jgi:hypothetical protein